MKNNKWIILVILVGAFFLLNGCTDVVKWVEENEFTLNTASGDVSQAVSSGDLSPVKKPAITEAEFQKKVFAITDASKCSKYSWNDRGTTKKSYYRGMALTYAKAYCSPNQIVSAARNKPESKFDTTDVLSWYNSNYNKLGLTNDVAGRNTQRNVWTLLIGLGMRESSGRYCCGRDMSANFSSANSAEAGLFQSSYGSKRSSDELVNLFEKYKKSKKGCYLDVFKEGFTCSESNLKNWGEGAGFEWQKLSKECPAFSAEWAAILVRKSGGTKGEYGPLRTKKAELNKDCHNMLSQVENVILENQDICKVIAP